MTTLKKLKILILFLLFLFNHSWAQEISLEPKPTVVWTDESVNEISSLDEPVALENVKLRHGTLARLYWARVLMEDYKRWPQSAELIRFVLANDKEIPSPVLRKLRRVHDALVAHSPKEFIRKALDYRHLTQPFLLSQYLLNECIMDLRVNLNFANNVELKFVEQTLQSYFFPGAEKVGTIIYPDDSVYKFDLYALTEANLASARLEASDESLPDSKNKSVTPLPPPGGGTTAPITPGPGVPPPPGIPPIAPPKDGGAIIPQSIINQGALDRLSLINRQTVDINPGIKILPPDSFLQELINVGVDFDDVSAYAKRLIEELKPSTRVTNRYLPQSLLLQALSDPGSVVLDPQLQDFLRGIKLKLELGKLSSSDQKSFIDIFNSLDGSLISKSKTENTWSIDLTTLMGESYQKGLSKNEILLEHDHNASADATLYLVTGVGGADLMRLRLFQMLFKVGSQSNAIHGFLQKNVSTNWDNLVAAAPKHLRQLYTQQARLWRSKSAIARLQGTALLIPQTFYGSVKLADSMLKFNKTEKVQKFIAYINSLQAVRLSKKLADPVVRFGKNNTVNGNFFYLLTAAAVVSEVGTGILDYNATSSEREKLDIALRSSSNTLSTITYVIPRLGWPAVAFDTANIIGWTNWSTAKLYSEGELFLYELFAGDQTTRFLKEHESSLLLPESEKTFIEIEEAINSSVSNPEELRTMITTNLQDLSHRYVLLTYLGHKDAARYSRYSFGEHLERYYNEFNEGRTRYNTYLEVLEEKIKKGFYKPVNNEPDDGSVTPDNPPLEN